MYRRDFLQTLAGLAIAPRSFAAMAATDNWIMMSCGADPQGHYFVGAVDAHGETLFKQPLPGRGHGLTISPDHQQLVVFARRPGEYIHILDIHSGETSAAISSQPTRRFYGHGVFSRDGRWLYVTANAFASGDGKIMVYDCHDNYRLVEEFPSYGIGPHQLVLLSDNRTLAVANGGIRTHPDLGRAKLNLDTMSSALSYIDTASGKLVDAYQLDKKYFQLSIRHLDINAEDKICVAMQYQGAANRHPPLIALHQGESALQLCHAPADVTRRMKNYCGSVTADASGNWFAVSSPRGNLATVWNAQSGEFQQHFDLNDVCGLAASAQPNEFIASSGQGDIGRAQVTDELHIISQQTSLHWDNHMVLLGRG